MYFLCCLKQLMSKYFETESYGNTIEHPGINLECNDNVIYKYLNIVYS